MAYADDLIEQAEKLARVDPRRPKQANLRRAVSAAYYAVFHELAERAAKALLPSEEAAGPAGAKLRRVIQHGAVLKAAKWFRGPAPPPPSIQAMRRAPVAVDPDLADFCRVLASLQDARHRSDYDLSVAIDRAETDRQIADAAAALRAVRRLAWRGDPLIFLLGCMFGDGLARNA